MFRGGKELELPKATGALPCTAPKKGPLKNKIKIKTGTRSFPGCISLSNYFEYPPPPPFSRPAPTHQPKYHVFSLLDVPSRRPYRVAPPPSGAAGRRPEATPCSATRRCTSRRRRGTWRWSRSCWRRATGAADGGRRRPGSWRKDGEGGGKGRGWVGWFKGKPNGF